MITGDSCARIYQKVAHPPSHRDIYEPYGTMADFDELLKTMHEHGLKLIMDLVVNHCSSEVSKCLKKIIPN